MRNDFDTLYSPAGAQQLVGKTIARVECGTAGGAGARFGERFDLRLVFADGSSVRLWGTGAESEGIDGRLEAAP